VTDLAGVARPAGQCDRAEWRDREEAV
jgi:hypothetical protein